MAGEAWMGGTEKLEVIAGTGEAEFTVDRSAHQIGVAIVLSVVLPPADGAEAERVGDVESFETAAEATHTRKWIHVA